MPSIEAMLITFAGRRSALAAARKGAASALVRKNGDLTLRFITLSQPLSGNSSKGAPQAAPALLIRMSSLPSRLMISSASALQPATVEMSCGIEIHGPIFDSSAAVALQASALRAEM